MPRPGASCRRTFVLRTHLTQRYGAGFLPEDMTIQDWGVTYDELEPHYDRFEYLCGTSGQAGNVKGQIIDGGNPFEGPRSDTIRRRRRISAFSYTLFAKAARELGYKPFPQPSGNLSPPLSESTRRASWSLHLLRLLRMVRLRQLFQSDAANHDPADAAA